MAQVCPHISGVSRTANSTDELLELAKQYIAENGAPIVYRTGARRLVHDRMPPSYDPPSSYGAFDKRNPHVCARWSDN